MYFSRDARMFEDGEVRPDIERMFSLSAVGVQGVVDDEPANGGCLFVFVVPEKGYLWLSWGNIHLTKARRCRAMWRMALGSIK